MAEDNTPSQASPVRERFMSLLFKPVEYGMVGGALVLVLWMAQYLSVLPQSFKGFGIEVEIPDDQESEIQRSFDQIADLQTQVEKLKEDLEALVVDLEENTVVPLAISSAQIAEGAPDIIPEDALVLVEQEPVSGTGYLWIGTRDETGWIDASMENISDWPDPALMKGAELRASTAINLREALPAEDETYFSDVPRLGTVAREQAVRIIETPVTYPRAGVEQVWARAEAIYTPVIP